MKPAYTVQPVSWQSREADAAREIRTRVFVHEQNVPAELELDETDVLAHHVIAVNSSGEACGTGRLFPDKKQPELGHIGRMAVLAASRGSGCGSAILDALIKEARRHGFVKVVLSAQTHAVEFYARHGFTPYGDEYT